MTYKESREKIKETISKLICKLYKINITGGAFHIVVDDYNVDDECIEWCLEHIKEYAQSQEEIDICKNLGHALLKIPEQSRYDVITERNTDNDT